MVQKQGSIQRIILFIRKRPSLMMAFSKTDKVQVSLTPYAKNLTSPVVIL